jgi:hypothetical protein
MKSQFERGHSAVRKSKWEPDPRQVHEAQEGGIMILTIMPLF